MTTVGSLYRTKISSSCDALQCDALCRQGTLLVSPHVCPSSHSCLNCVYWCKHRITCPLLHNHGAAVAIVVGQHTVGPAPASSRANAEHVILAFVHAHAAVQCSTGMVMGVEVKGTPAHLDEAGKQQPPLAHSGGLDKIELSELKVLNMDPLSLRLL